MDLSEFVSDYWAMYRENGGKRPTAREIAQAYGERAVEEPGETRDYDTIVQESTPQVAYYLP